MPIITIGSASTNGVTLSNCRLVYSSVKFSPELNQKLVAKLNSGYTKKVYYRVTDTYLPNAGDIAQTGGTLTKLVSPSTVHPLRVWLLGCPTTALSTAGSDIINGCFSFQAQFSNANISINNTNYYNNALNTASEFWSILQDQFPKQGLDNDSCSLISYSDFMQSYRLHCFDVSRLKDRLRNANEAVSIQIQATRSNATSCDYYYLVERLQLVTFQFSSSETKLVIGLN